MSPPAKRPACPVIMPGPTITVPSGLSSTPGTRFKKVLSVCWPSARTTASASSFSNCLVGLEGVCRHVGAIAVVDDQRLFGAEAPGRSRGVHRRVATAIDNDASAEARHLARANAAEEAHCIKDVG